MNLAKLIRAFPFSVSQAALLVVTFHAVLADDHNAPELAQRFREEVRPLLQRHCLACHDSIQQEAELDLSDFRELADVNRSHGIWEIVLERVAAHEMPPQDAEQPLGQQPRQTIVDWIRAVRDFEAARTAGDPGEVLLRRLSNSEFDNCIRDLTGVDMHPTHTFPVDPANEAGFDNSGESLMMSPALMKKYLEAARLVAEHLVLTPRGISFAPHAVATDTDRDKYCVKRIVEFYQRQPTNYAEYFYAAWRYRRRSDARTTLNDIAAEQRVSPKYLQTVWSLLVEPRATLGPMAKLRSLWMAAAEMAPAEAQVACTEMSDYVKKTRKDFEPHFDNLRIQGVHDGAQPFVLWKNKQYANNRSTADFSRIERSLENAVKDVRGSSDADSELTELWNSIADDKQRREFKDECRLFCSVFPDAFFISERGRDYLDKPRDEQEKGRLLSAGFHSMMGYFRDDKPLMELILDESGQQELNELWQELDFFTAAPHRQYQGFLWFERTDSRFMRDEEFDFARPENKAALTQPLIERLAQVYLDKATRNGGDDVALSAISDYFREINQQIRWVDQARLEAEPKQLDAVIALAERAHRRPLAEGDKRELREFYQTLRSSNALEHYEALQDLLVSVLISPQFSYRTDLLAESAEIQALDDFELASRLSFFIWSSMPDAELWQSAESGDLHKPEVLKQQTKRMLSDPRVRGLATEFLGNWLDFRRFEEHNSVDRQRFNSFDDELRSAMFEEPIRFFIDLAQHQRSVLELLYAKHTFVNRALADHYGIEGLDWSELTWQKVHNADHFGRGGLLPMAVFLTKNAPGLRTSPVKRGYWVVKRLLGERIPPPPPTVPELPDDESQLGEMTLRETLAKHREHESCAGCHNRIDSFGLVFEGYGPVGERRTLDLGGRDIDSSAEFPDGSRCSTVTELTAYIRSKREADFLSNFHRKLLSYALNRSLQLSDQKLLDQLRDVSVLSEANFGQAVEMIVGSPQFLHKRSSPR